MATAAAVTTRVQNALGDPLKVRFPDDELLVYVSAGQRQIVQYFPEATATVIEVAVMAFR